MTNLNRPIKRVSRGFVHEQGKAREIVVILRPPNVIGFRAKGCRKEYQLTTEGCYTMAVRAHVRTEKEAKKKGGKRK